MAAKDAEVQLALGRPDATIAAAAVALVIEGDYSRAHATMGVTEERKGNLEAARARFRRALEMDPNERRENLGQNGA